MLTLVGGILLVLYFFEWYQVKQEEKLINSYLITSNTIESNVKDIDALNQIRQEAASDYFIYLGYNHFTDKNFCCKGQNRLYWYYFRYITASYGRRIPAVGQLS